ncbi:hypothetical protein DFH28DRAFT_938699 [Melampsora americana]|nr:hypothetical protein DFH28DRAFT_938699 [Melampsora americana]
MSAQRGKRLGKARMRRGQTHSGARITHAEKRYKGAKDNVGPKVAQGQMQGRAQVNPRWPNYTQVMQFTWDQSQRRAEGNVGQTHVGPKCTQAQLIWSAKVDDKCTPKYMQKSQRRHRATKSTWAKILEE